MPKEDLLVMTETVHGFMPPVARRVWFSRGAAGLVRLETKERSRKESYKDRGTNADHSMPRLGSFRLHEGASRSPCRFLSPTTGNTAGEVPRSCSSYAFLQVLPGLDEESNKFEQTRVRRGKTGQMQVSVSLGVASCRFEWQGRLHF